MRRLWLGVIAVIWLSLASVSPTLAAVGLILAPSSGAAGSMVQGTASSFPSGPVTLWWDNEVLLATDSSGLRVRHMTFQVPTGAAAGPHTVRACSGSQCPPGTTYDDATFTVTAGPTPSPTSSHTPSPTPKATPKPTPKPTPSPTRPPTPAPTPPPEASPAPTESTTSALPGGGATSALPEPGQTHASPGPAGPGVVVPTADPAADPYGGVKVQFFWEREPLAVGLGLAILVIGAAGLAIWLARRRRRPFKPLFAAPVLEDAEGPTLMKGLSAGTHDPPASSSGPWTLEGVLRHEAPLLEGDAGVGGNETITVGGTKTEAPAGPPNSGLQEITVSEQIDQAAPDGDIQIKGSKIKEN